MIIIYNATVFLLTSINYFSDIAHRLRNFYFGNLFKKKFTRENMKTNEPIL